MIVSGICIYHICGTIHSVFSLFCKEWMNHGDKQNLNILHCYFQQHLHCILHQDALYDIIYYFTLSDNAYFQRNTYENMSHAWIMYITIYASTFNRFLRCTSSFSLFSKDPTLMWLGDRKSRKNVIKVSYYYVSHFSWVLTNFLDTQFLCS